MYVFIYVCMYVLLFCSNIIFYKIFWLSLSVANRVSVVCLMCNKVKL